MNIWTTIECNRCGTSNSFIIRTPSDEGRCRNCYCKLRQQDESIKKLKHKFEQNPIETFDESESYNIEDPLFKNKFVKYPALTFAIILGIGLIYIIISFGFDLLLWVFQEDRRVGIAFWIIAISSFLLKHVLSIFDVDEDILIALGMPLDIISGISTIVGTVSTIKSCAN